MRTNPVMILIPKGAHRAPIMLTRTPYGATDRIMKNSSALLSALIDSTDVADYAVVNGGYIRVMQASAASAAPKGIMS